MLATVLLSRLSLNLQAFFDAILKGFHLPISGGGLA